MILGSLNFPIISDLSPLHDLVSECTTYGDQQFLDSEPLVIKLFLCVVILFLAVLVQPSLLVVVLLCWYSRAFLCAVVDQCCFHCGGTFWLLVAVVAVVAI